ncbi:MAG: efflux RND transporter periplasmic adaptor subunit [Desulfovibrionaceae bacterium]|nr:efflux RND transporter periplasmic adaptor subunit [Desulfovibrionaceae bacterium]
MTVCLQKIFASALHLRSFLLSAWGVIIIVGCLNACEHEPKKQVVAAPPTVLYQTVKAQKVILTREVPGRVSPLRMAYVRPQVGGILQKRHFKEGMTVQAGQPLYQIDPAPYRATRDNALANLEKARAREDAAKRHMERCILLAQSNAVRKQERDEAIAAYKQIRAEIDACEELLATAEINLGYTSVKAPVGGRIGRSYVTEGALLTPNQEQPLAVIRQLDPIFVDVTQSSAEIVTLRQAFASGALQRPDVARVRLTLENGSPYLNPRTNEPVDGELLFSEIATDPETGTVTIRARFENPDGLLLPGMYVRAYLVEGKMEKAISIPQRSVGRDMRNRPQVYVLEASDTPNIFIAKPRLVFIERDHKGQWLVREGLKEGELLLVEGLLKVRPGQKVIGKPFKPTESASEEG